MPRGGVLIDFPSDPDLPMAAKSKVDDPAFRIAEYIGVDEVEIKAGDTPSGRAYHFGEDPEEIKYAVHTQDLAWLRAVGLIGMRHG